MNTPTDNENGEIKKPADAALENSGGAPTGLEGDKKPGSGDGEVKVFLAGADGSLPPKRNNRGFQNRINGLNAKIETAEGGEATATAALTNAQSEIQVLRLALQQKQETATPPGPPDPLTFHDGASDAKYLAAFGEYIEGMVEKRTANLAPPPANPTNSGLQARQVKHYEAAAVLGVKDFPETEDKAIAILGKSTVNFIIENAVNSPRILYYLGKNPDDAEELAHLVQSSKPGQAVMFLGVLDRDVKLSSDANPSTVPNPDEELEGTLLTSTSDNKYDRQLDKLRTAGDINAIMAFKRKHREQQRA